MGRILVTLQFVISAMLVLTSRPSRDEWPWLIVAGAGVLVGIWSITAIGWRRVKVLPETSQHTELCTAAPYRFVRHPMYSGLLLFCFGLTFMPWQWWKLGAIVGLVCVLTLKSRIEEQHLRTRFPEYVDYARTTKRFVPFVW